jgi:Bacterial PH domain
MPLPFMTADPVDATPAPTTGKTAGSAGAALPYDDEARPRRPYRPGPWRVCGAALMLLLASYVLFAALIIAVAGSLPVAGICVAVAALVITLAVRLVRVGIWVSPAGLRQARLLSSTLVPWQDVAAVRTVQQPVRWLGLPRTVQGQALIVSRRQGEPLPAVVTDRNADFLGRPEAFDMAADAVAGRLAEYRG